MPTLIDSLVVKLGLDSRDLSSKSPAATKQLEDVEKAGDDAEKSVKKLSKTTKEASSAFSDVAKSAGAFLAVLGGAAALKAFISDFIETNAQLKRFSDNIGVSVENVSAWGQAAEQFGGSAAGLQGTLDMLSKSQTQLRLTGESSLIPLFSYLSISAVDFNGRAKSSLQLLEDIGNAIDTKGMSRADANNTLRMFGIDQGTANLLLQDRNSREALIRKIKEQTAVTDSQAESARKLDLRVTQLRQRFEAFGRGILEKALPTLERFLDGMIRFGDWISQNGQAVGDFLKLAALELAALGAAAAIASIEIWLPIAGILALTAAIALLWQDYQTWKRGGESLIDWGKWKPEIDAAIAGIEALGRAAKATFGFVSTAVGVAKDFAHGNKAAAAIKLGFAPSQATTLNGPQSTTPSYMMDYFQKHGLSKDHAAGITANLMGESNGNTRAVGDGGKAVGLAQWHPDRQADFAKWAGHDIGVSTVDEQLAFVLHELGRDGSRSGAGKKLDAASGAYASGAVISKYYEAPADEAGNMASRGKYAESLMGAGDRSGGGGSQTIAIDKVEIHTQATDAKAMAEDVKPAFDYIFTSQANSGLQQ